MSDITPFRPRPRPTSKKLKAVLITPEIEIKNSSIGEGSGGQQALALKGVPGT